MSRLVRSLGMVEFRVGFSAVGSAGNWRNN